MLEITQEELDEPLPELFTAEKSGDAVGGVRMKRSNQEGRDDDDDDSSYGNDGDSQYSD